MSSGQPSMAADAEHLGELSSAERDRLYAACHATLMPGNWPEPFGLVAIESLACGTPVLSRRVGALPEIVREGVDGYFGDDAQQLAFRVADVQMLDRDVSVHPCSSDSRHRGWPTATSTCTVGPSAARASARPQP